jgi:hypothetical protein
LESAQDDDHMTTRRIEDVPELRRSFLHRSAMISPPRRPASTSRNGREGKYLE